MKAGKRQRGGGRGRERVCERERGERDGEEGGGERREGERKCHTGVLSIYQGLRG